MKPALKLVLLAGLMLAALPIKLLGEHYANGNEIITKLIPTLIVVLFTVFALYYGHRLQKAKIQKLKEGSQSK